MPFEFKVGIKLNAWNNKGLCRKTIASLEEDGFKNDYSARSYDLYLTEHQDRSLLQYSRAKNTVNDKKYTMVEIHTQCYRTNMGVDDKDIDPKRDEYGQLTRVSLADKDDLST